MSRPNSFPADPRNNPLARDYEDVSPALSLVLSTGEYDADGWPVMASFYVNDLVVVGGKVWRLVAFCRNNDAILAPHGLGHDKLISTIRVRGGFAHLPASEPTGWRHKDGLITFG